MRLFDWLTLLYPSEYRETFGAEMRLVFEQSLHEAAAAGLPRRMRILAMEFGGLAADVLAVRSAGLLRNTRKSWPPNRGWTGGFLRSLAPRTAALALLRNTRKLWPPNTAERVFLRSLAPRPAALALLRNTRKSRPLD